MFPDTRKNYMTSYGKISISQKFGLGIGGGLIAASCAIALLFPPSGATHAPKANLIVLDDVNVLSVPVASVVSEPLANLKPEITGLTVAQVRQRLAYDLDVVSSGIGNVPRVFLSSIPTDIGDIAETSLRKALFFKSVLPLVLQVNEGILEQRARLQHIKRLLQTGAKPSAANRLWLAMMSERYKVKRDDITALLHKVDVVPPSLALAQAAKESGWGMSRFAREGNALFGQWTWEKAGLVPDGRDAGKQHKIRSFPTILDSVEAYIHNLNTHRAYREYRTLRGDLRNQGKPLDGRLLAGELLRYSELGVEYVNSIRSMISHNKLRRFDGVRLNINNDQPEV